jgi:glutaredoxin
MIEDRYIIIGRSSCPFCIHAVDYSKSCIFQYIFLDYEEDRESLEVYKEFYGHKTLPIILANNLETGYTKKIGGYRDFIDLATENFTRK